MNKEFFSYYNVTFVQQKAELFVKKKLFGIYDTGNLGNFLPEINSRVKLPGENPALFPGRVINVGRGYTLKSEFFLEFSTS